MFTGLVQAVGRVVGSTRGGAGEGTLRIEAAPWGEPWCLGESVAVQGACLTLCSAEGKALAFDVLDESFERTTLGTLDHGAPVNLERSLRLGDRLGGHLVTGHVDGVGAIRRIATVGRDIALTVEPPRDLLRYCARKGSITLDGVSLTVVSCTETAFSVCLIPTTRQHTVARYYREKQAVNIEIDIIARYVESLGACSRASSGSASAVTESLLVRTGFI